MKKLSLTQQIILCLLLGIATGAVYRHFYPDVQNLKPFAENLQLLSDIFLRLIKMIIAPLVFSLLFVGIAKAGDSRTIGRMGLKTILWFTFATLVALTFGLAIANWFEPGKRIVFDLSTAVASEPKPFIAKEFIERIFPESIVDVMARNQILPIIVFVIFFALATAALKERGKVIVDFFDAVGHAMLKVTDYVMKFAPVAVFGAVASIIALKGLGILYGYLYLISCFFGGLLVFIFGFLFLVCVVIKINFFKLLKAVKEPTLLAFSTASSESAMPMLIECLEKFGFKNRVVSFVLPLGYSFNLDGSIMYMTFATLTISQAAGMDITLGQQITMMLILLVSSKGMAGVRGASIAVISGMLVYFNIPLQNLALILAIDWLLDMGRSGTNIIGNAVATALIDRWEGKGRDTDIE
jgi:Na+/H+-dicarboxylate symporter